VTDEAARPTDDPTAPPSEETADASLPTGGALPEPEERMAEPDRVDEESAGPGPGEQPEEPVAVEPSGPMVAEQAVVPESEAVGATAGVVEEPAVVAEVEEPAAEEPRAVEEGQLAEEKQDAQVEVEEKPEKRKKPVREKAVGEEPVEEPKSENMAWYILKVQSNREESIREGLQRRVAIAGLGRFFGDVIVPIEKVTEVKGGRKRVIKRKLYPGYLVVQMEINDDTWFLVRETPGIGDFTGAAGRPTPMLPHEVARIVSTQEEKSDAAPKLQITFSRGDRVKINEGTFENFEGEVETIDEASGRVIVMINIFGRSTPVELEYWQIEAL